MHGIDDLVNLRALIEQQRLRDERRKLRFVCLVRLIGGGSGRPQPGYQIGGAAKWQQRRHCHHEHERGAGLEAARERARRVREIRDAVQYQERASDSRGRTVPARVDDETRRDHDGQEREHDEQHATEFGTRPQAPCQGERDAEQRTGIQRDDGHCRRLEMGARSRAAVVEPDPEGQRDEGARRDGAIGRDARYVAARLSQTQKARHQREPGEETR